MYKKIVLAYDGSLENQQAIINCKDLSQWEDAHVHLVSVVAYDAIAMGHETAYFNEYQNKIEEGRCLTILQEGIAQLTASGISAQGELLKGDPVSRISTYANSVGADLIMLGHKHRNNWLERWWKGSISQSLIEISSCSVLVVITSQTDF